MTQKEQTVPLSVFRKFLEEVQLIATQKDVTDVAQIVIEKTCEVLNCDRTSFFFVDDEYLDLVIGKGADNIRLPKSTGIAGACATQGKLINILDAYQDERFNKKFDKESGYRTKTILCAPVREPDGEIVGVLQAINKKDGNPFDSIDEQLVSCLAGQVGVSIRYAFQLEQAQRTSDQKNALVSHIKSMNSNTNVASLLFTLNKAASELLEADRCTFYTVNHQTATLQLVTTDGVVDFSFPMKTGIAGYVATNGIKLNIEDAYKDERFNDSFDKKTGYRTKSMLVLPVFANETDRQGQKPIGVCQLINKLSGEGIFTTEDEEILGVLLRFIGPIIATSNLFQSKNKNKLKEQPQHITTELIRTRSRDHVNTPKSVPEPINEEDDKDDQE